MVSVLCGSLIDDDALNDNFFVFIRSDVGNGDSGWFIEEGDKVKKCDAEC